MGADDWTTILTCISVAVAVAGAGVAVWQAHTATAQRQAADDSARSAWDSARAAEVQAEQAKRQADTAEQQVTIMREQLDAERDERDEREGPVFEVGDQPGKLGPALASLNGDTAAVPVTLVAGPDLERVNITARGPVHGIIALGCNLVGSSLHWDRPELHGSITVSLSGGDPAHDLHATLVLECHEKPPGTRTWMREHRIIATGINVW